MIELAETVKEVRAYLLRNSFDEQSSWYDFFFMNLDSLGTITEMTY